MLQASPHKLPTKATRHIYKQIKTNHLFVEFFTFINGKGSLGADQCTSRRYNLQYSELLLLELAGLVDNEFQHKRLQMRTFAQVVGWLEQDRSAIPVAESIGKAKVGG